MGGAQCAKAYWSDFHREKCLRSGLSEGTEKRGLSLVQGDEKFFGILVSTGWGYGTQSLF